MNLDDIFSTTQDPGNKNDDATTKSIANHRLVPTSNECCYSSKGKSPDSLMSTTKSPACMVSPTATEIETTFPETGAETTVSIFMALHKYDPNPISTSTYSEKTFKPQRTSTPTALVRPGLLGPGSHVLPLPLRASVLRRIQE